MSCLQGRTQAEAFAALRGLPVDGVQLTPGNLPSPGFREEVESYEGVVRFHHGFSWEAYRRPVYEMGAPSPRIGGTEWSVHPPKVGAAPFDGWLEASLKAFTTAEVMYPGYLLGEGHEVDAAIEAGLSLAVDTSHLLIQRQQGTMTEAALERLLRYERIVEVHVSNNDGRTDAHRPLAAETFLLGWARERLSAGTVVVYESYLHRLTPAERFNQLALLRST